MQQAKEELIYWAKRLYDKGMSPATSSNISMLFGKNILISATGTCLGDLTPEDIVLMDFDANVLEGSKKPSGEKYLHINIYLKREDIKAVIHSHCPLIGGFACAGKKMSKAILPDFVYGFGEIPIAPYATPSSEKLANITSKYFDENDCVLMANHGIITGSDSLKNCFYNLEALRAYAETYFASEILGGAKTLSHKNIKDIEKLKVF